MKDAGVYTCHNDEEKGKELSVTIKHRPDVDQDNLEGKNSDRRAK